MPAKPARKANGRHFPPITISRADFLSQGTDQAFREKIYTMVLALDVLMACRRGFGALADLTGSQFAVLIGVAYQAGESGATIRRISDHVQLAQPHVTTEVSRLIKRKLLNKHKHPVDGRSVSIALTPLGQDLVERLAPVIRGVNDLLFRKVDPADFDAANRVMRAIISHGDHVAAVLRQTEPVDAYAKTGRGDPRGKTGRHSPNKPAQRRSADG